MHTCLVSTPLSQTETWAANLTLSRLGSASSLPGRSLSKILHRLQGCNANWNTRPHPWVTPNRVHQGEGELTRNAHVVTFQPPWGASKLSTKALTCQAQIQVDGQKIKLMAYLFAASESASRNSDDNSFGGWPRLFWRRKRQIDSNSPLTSVRGALLPSPPFSLFRLLPKSPLACSLQLLVMEPNHGRW